MPFSFHVRLPPIAISVAVLLCVLTAFHLSFAQQTSSGFFLEISDEIINPGETVSARISGIMEPTVTKDVMVRFFPPPGTDEPMQSSKLHLQADSVGFANGTVWYPNDVQNDTIQQLGNYTVLVQDMQTGTLVQRASFEVAKPETPPNFLSTIPVGVLITAAVGLTGAGLTVFYNYFSAKRQTRVALTQKKAEQHLTLRHHYNHVFTNIRNIRDSLGKLNEMNDQKDERNGEMEEEYRWCFYNILRFLKDDREIFNKAGMYFLDDQRGASMMSLIRDSILDKLIEILTRRGFSEATRIALMGGFFVDFESKLNEEPISGLYKQFKIGLKNHTYNKYFDYFILDLNLFSNLLLYEDENLFNDWFPRRKQSRILNKEVRDEIITDLKKVSLYNHIQKKLDYPSISLAERLWNKISLPFSYLKGIRKKE